MRGFLKVIAGIAGLCACILLAVWYLIAVPLWGGSNTRDALANSDRLRQHVVEISHVIGPRPHNRLDKLDETADYVFKNLSAFGVPRFQEFDVDGEINKNVIIRLKGSENCQDGLIVVGAHYDTYLNTPGADDNASGVAGLIELARVIKERTLPCDIELVAYTLEEPPNFRTKNMGSFHHAQFLKKSNVSVNLMISLEMIGYFSDKPGTQHYPAPGMDYAYGDRGNFVAVVGDLDNREPIRDVKQSFLKTGRINTEAISAPNFVEGIDFSDHLNYLKLGFPAIMVTDTAFFRNANYHRPSDTYDTLDYDKMAAVVDSVYYALRDLMNRPRS